MNIENGQTKDKIIILLKKNDGLTTGELSRHVGITPMGIRQHLLALERKNLIRYEMKKNGIGRPAFVYRLTELADDVFPKGYPSFTLDLLSDLEATDGRDKIDAVFRKRKERLFEKMAGLLARYDFDEKINVLSTVLGENGYFVELADEGNGYALNLYNCPISRISYSYSEACNYEMELISELLGTPATLNKAVSNRDSYCSVGIPKA